MSQVETKQGGKGRQFKKYNDIKNQLEGTDKTSWERMLESDRKRDPSAYKAETPDWMKDEPITHEDRVAALNTLEERGWSINKEEDTLHLVPPKDSEASRGTLDTETFDALSTLDESRNTNTAPGLRNIGKGRSRVYTAPYNKENKAAIKEHQASHVGGGGDEGGGDGECCIFNQYGGGGCGPCNKGGGPELLPPNHSPDHSYDSIFGVDKPDKDTGVQTVVKDGNVYFRFYAIGPGINRHDWGVDTDYIAENMPTIMDSDITFMRALKEDGTPYYPHPAIPGANAMINQQFQKRYVVGKPVDYERKPDADGNWYGIGKATEAHVKELLAELAQSGQITKTKQGAMELPLFVSPQILHYNDEDPTKIKKWWFQHVTITDDPAFPPAFAKITGACVGDEGKCVAQLKQAGPNLDMPCFAMAMKEILKKNGMSTIDDIIDNNTSLIAKQGSLNLDKQMPDKPNEPNPDTQAGNVNDNQTISKDQTPKLPEPQHVDSEKVNEHIKGLVDRIFKDGAKTEAEKALVAELETVKKQLDEEKKGKQTLQGQIDNINQQNTKRDIELLLIGHEAAFLDKDGKFDEAKFNEEVQYWLDKKLPVDAIQKDIERVMGYAKASRKAAKTQAYAGPGQSSEGQSMDDIYTAPEVGANLPKEVETEQASMSGMVDESKLWFIPKKGGRIA